MRPSLTCGLAVCLERQRLKPVAIRKNAKAKTKKASKKTIATPNQLNVDQYQPHALAVQAITPADTNPLTQVKIKLPSETSGSPCSFHARHRLLSIPASLA